MSSIMAFARLAFPLPAAKRSVRCRLRRLSATATSPAGAAASSSNEQLWHGRALVRSAVADFVRRSQAHICVDATCGRGSDTLTLARALGRKGTVHAFDIQPDAIAETAARHAELEAQHADVARLVTHCNSHAHLAAHLPPPAGGVPLVAATIWNLGWYPAPGADRNLITLPKSTLSSLDAAATITAIQGGLIVTCYTGHDGGQEEADAVMRWVKALPPRSWNCVFIDYPNRNNAPCVHICERIR